MLIIPGDKANRDHLESASTDLVNIQEERGQCQFFVVFHITRYTRKRNAFVTFKGSFGL